MRHGIANEILAGQMVLFHMVFYEESSAQRFGYQGLFAQLAGGLSSTARSAEAGDSRSRREDEGLWFPAMVLHDRTAAFAAQV